MNKMPCHITDGRQYDDGFTEASDEELEVIKRMKLLALDIEIERLRDEQRESELD